jgi:hypothetical protein
MTVLSEYSYMYIVCEGTNEEEVINWILENNFFVIDSFKVNTDYSRARSKKSSEEMVHEITQYDYDGKVAVLYVHDSAKEKWHGLINRACNNELLNSHIDVIDIITAPEIEVLYIYSNDELLKKWNKGSKVKPSIFCKQYLKCNDIKNKGKFLEKFPSFEIFVSACKKYKSCNKKNSLTIYDLIKTRE